MIAIYGSRSESIDFGHRETRRCSQCGALAAFNLVLDYRFYHLFFELGAVVEKKHRLVCQACGFAEPTPAPMDLRTSSRIPIQRRFGLYAFLVFVFAVTIPELVGEYAKVLK